MPTSKPLHGWLNVDKPCGIRSARVVARVRQLAGGVKVGHAGTLDPLATGVLPLALGEATKTTAYVVGRSKTYRFTVAWGEERDTDDASGRIVATSAGRPSHNEICSALDAFTGQIDQIPPSFAAVKVSGKRAYALARRGEQVSISPRKILVEQFSLIDLPDANTATFEVRCGKGTYVRALARDLARHLGTLGHVTSLRRTAVGQFREADAISLDKIVSLMHISELDHHLRGVATVLADIPALAVTDSQARRLRCGQTITCGEAIATIREECGIVRVMAGDGPVALAQIAEGIVRPVRVFNFS